MRLGWLGLVAVALHVARADPPKPATPTNPASPATPSARRPVEPLVVPVPDPRDPQRLPGATRGTGIIIEPPADFADARDYPLGMVIRPPDVHDDGIWISPGALDESLRGFARRLQDGLGAFGKLFQQH